MFISLPPMTNKIPLETKDTRIRVADWLVSNTSLTKQQIAEITELDDFLITKIFNDEINLRYMPLNPIDNKLITQEELDFLQSEEGNTNFNEIQIYCDKDISLNYTDVNELFEEDIFFAKIIKIYFLVQGHNAWHSVWSSKFDKSRSFHTSLKSAKMRAEKQRTQGRVFTIEELPAICFYTRKGIFIMAGINSSSIPFNSCRHFDSFDTFKNNIKRIERSEKYPKYVFAKYHKNIYIDDLKSYEKFYLHKSYIYNGSMDFNKNEYKFNLEYIKNTFDNFVNVLSH